MAGRSFGIFSINSFVDRVMADTSWQCSLLRSAVPFGVPCGRFVSKMRVDAVSNCVDRLRRKQHPFRAARFHYTAGHIVHHSVVAARPPPVF